MASADGASGRVLQLNRKAETPGEHGLPKQPVPEADVTPAGVEGDFNVYRHEEMHDDPANAVLIMPREMIEEFRSEGWPVRPGDLGENITSQGIPYDQFAPGRRFRVGGAVLEVSKPCAPCRNLYLLPYVGTDRGPEFLKATLNRRGWYARVLVAGHVRTGDPIVPVPS